MATTTVVDRHLAFSIELDSSTIQIRGYSITEENSESSAIRVVAPPSYKESYRSDYHAQNGLVTIVYGLCCGIGSDKEC